MIAVQKIMVDVLLDFNQYRDTQEMLARQIIMVID